jgi:hypothetical protein
MRTISKTISFSSILLILLATIIAPTAVANDILLSSTQGARISISVERQHVTARDKEKNINYDVDGAVARYLKRADDIRLIANESSPRAQLFIVLAREYSRPGAMGQGYCGAGYEDHLLLVEIFNRKLVLRDQLLLQSCLKSMSMFIDQGDDHPSNGFTHEKDGSLSYRLVDDDYEKKRILTVTARRFKITLIPSTKQ